MKKKPEIVLLNIVFVGNFNPVIFTPAWFASKNLIGETESESANVRIIHSDIAIFELPWFQFHATRDRFSVVSEQEAYFPSVFDLAVGTFQLLQDTPIQVMGINRGFHIQCDSEEEWHRFGYFLAPQTPWQGVFRRKSALKRIEITEKYSTENPSDGRLTVIVEPSGRVRFGLFFLINDHYSVDSQQKPVGSKKIISALKEKWEESDNKSKMVIKTITDNFLNKGQI